MIGMMPRLMEDDMPPTNPLYLAMGLALWLLIWISICRHLESCYRTIPQELRMFRPGLVWLLVIPWFNVLWNFIVFPLLFKTYQSSLRALGKSYYCYLDQVVALLFCVLSAYLTVESFIPGKIIELGYWVVLDMALFVIVLFRTGRLQKRLQAAVTMPAAAKSPQ